MINRKSDIEKKIKKCINILGEKELKIIATEEATLLNGNAFELAKLTQTIIHKLLDNGVPKDALKDMVSLPFMDEKELEKKNGRNFGKTNK